jgi:hypothetical protein
MKKWIWWVVGGVAIYVVYTMFIKKNGSSSSDDTAARMRSNARVRSNGY